MRRDPVAARLRPVLAVRRRDPIRELRMRDLDPRERAVSARTTRRDPGARRATVADLLLLEKVGRQAGAFSSRHARRFMQRSPGAVRRRLRTLYDLGLLSVHLDAGDRTRPNWYTLTHRARGRLAEVFDREPADYPVRRTLPRQLAHHAAVVDHLIDIELAAAHMHGVALTRLQLPRERRRRGVVVPDLVADVLVEGRAQRLLVEVDLGTESPHQVALKARGYMALVERGGPPLCVLITVPKLRRRNTLLRRLAEECLPSGIFYIALAPKLTFRSFFAKDTWRAMAPDPDGVVRAPRADPLARDHEGGSP